MCAQQMYALKSLRASILWRSVFSFRGGGKYFKWHPLLVTVYKVDILNIGLMEGMKLYCGK